MDSNIKKYEISKEREKSCFEDLKKAKPYTREEVRKIPLDSYDFDWDRLIAYIAQQELRKAGIID